jgi:hypothetical protein
MALVIAILDAIAAIPAIAGYLNTLIQGIIGWYIAKQHSDTLAAIADAAALAARAVTDDERYKAAQAWKDALSRGRTSA